MNNLGSVFAFCALICFFIAGYTQTTPWWAWVIGGIVLFVTGAVIEDFRGKKK